MRRVNDQPLLIEELPAGGMFRYDTGLHLTGPLSLSAVGYHRRRFEPTVYVESWHEGENLLSLNWHPHFNFVFGYEYQTRESFPTLSARRPPCWSPRCAWSLSWLAATCRYATG